MNSSAWSLHRTVLVQPDKLCLSHRQKRRMICSRMQRLTMSCSA